MRVGTTPRDAWRVAIVVLVLSLGLAAAACGGDGESAGTTEPSAATADAPATTTAAADTGSWVDTGGADTGAADETGAAEEGFVTDYLAYVGGTAGPADSSLSPIAIGLINQQGGPVPFPGGTAGAELAVKHVNEELGGVRGHPIELHTCFVAQSEEEGQKCAQQLGNDDDVAVITFPLLAVGNESFHAVNGGQKPVVIGVSASPADTGAENTFILYGSQTSILGPWGTLARDVLGAKTAAMIYPEVAGATTGAEAIEEALERAGIEVKSVGFDLQAADLLGPLTAAGAQSADMIVPFADAPNCIKVAKALGQIGGACGLDSELPRPGGGPGARRSARMDLRHLPSPTPRTRPTQASRRTWRSFPRTEPKHRLRMSSSRWASRRS